MSKIGTGHESALKETSSVHKRSSWSSAQCRMSIAQLFERYFYFKTGHVVTSSSILIELEPISYSL